MAIFLDKSDNYGILMAISPLPLHIFSDSWFTRGLVLGSSALAGSLHAALLPRLCYSVTGQVKALYRHFGLTALPVAYTDENRGEVRT